MQSRREHKFIKKIYFYFDNRKIELFNIVFLTIFLSILYFLIKEIREKTTQSIDNGDNINFTTSRRYYWDLGDSFIFYYFKRINQNTLFFFERKIKTRIVKCYMLLHFNFFILYLYSAHYMVMVSSFFLNNFFFSQNPFTNYYRNSTTPLIQ